jgi:dUTPase
MYLEKERVCSLFIFPVFNESLEIVDDLGTTNRGENRFGSSGR